MHQIEPIAAQDETKQPEITRIAGVCTGRTTAITNRILTTPPQSYNAKCVQPPGELVPSHLTRQTGVRPHTEFKIIPQQVVSVQWNLYNRTSDTYFAAVSTIKMSTAPISLHVYKGGNGIWSSDRIIKAADKNTDL